ncbi:hypothetical protein AB0368_12695 [Actinoplanes sp. NPDC051475]|uniref:hypothetical protein n=1 Tax=Actinoplanes sp. NPDC051475 TaxID=3157225 RepID=UPI00344C672F
MGAPQQFEAATSIDAHQFLVAERNYIFIPALMAANGLFSLSTGCMTIYVGASSGLVTVAVEPRTTPPATTELDDWEEIGEGDLYADTGDVIVRALMDNPPDLPALTTHGPGNYRVRIHAKGRDLRTDLVAFEPTENYLIQAWPSPVPADAITIKQSDSYGAALRRTTYTHEPSEPRTAPPQRANPVQAPLKRLGELTPPRGHLDYLRHASAGLGFTNGPGVVFPPAEGRCANLCH